MTMYTQNEVADKFPWVPMFYSLNRAFMVQAYVGGWK